MKKISKKIKLSIVIVSIIIIYIISVNCFNLINNYFEKGYANKYRVSPHRKYFRK